MAGSPTPRPAQERVGRIGVEGIDGPGIEIAGEIGHHVPGPAVHPAPRWITLAGETAEHLSPGVADQDDEAGLAGNPIIGSR